jgi:hypothetical protein
MVDLNKERRSGELAIEGLSTLEQNEPDSLLTLYPKLPLECCKHEQFPLRPWRP